MGPRYAPLIMAFFFFILTCNLLGLLPWGASPTGNLAVTGALALIAFFVIEVGGMIKLGFKGYMGTIFPHIEGLPPAATMIMSIGMAPIEFMSKLVKPFAITATNVSQASGQVWLHASSDGEAAQESDVVVMAAAVADFRPAHYTDVKIKKTHHTTASDDPTGSGPTIALVRNPDVLAELVQSRGAATSPVIVGFAAETGDAGHTVLDHARDKLARKGCDIIVANEVGVDKTFGQDTNTVHILRRGVDAVTEAGPAPKDTVAAAVWDVIQDVLSSG